MHLHHLCSFKNKNDLQSNEIVERWNVLFCRSWNNYTMCHILTLFAVLSDMRTNILALTQPVFHHCSLRAVTYIFSIDSIKYAYGSNSQIWRRLKTAFPTKMPMLYVFGNTTIEECLWRLVLVARHKLHVRPCLHKAVCLCTAHITQEGAQGSKCSHGSTLSSMMPSICLDAAVRLMKWLSEGQALEVEVSQEPAPAASLLLLQLLLWGPGLFKCVAQFSALHLCYWLLYFSILWLTTSYCCSAPAAVGVRG